MAGGSRGVAGGSRGIRDGGVIMVMAGVVRVTHFMHITLIMLPNLFSIIFILCTYKGCPIILARSGELYGPPCK